MNVKRLEVAAVQIVAHQQKLLQEPDPQLKGGFRVPSDLSGCDYSAQDWESCWQMGAIDFEDAYALSHQGKLPSKENLRKCGDYLFCNKLDPAFVENWKIAWTRLRAADVIKVSEAPAPVQEQESQAPTYIDIEKMPSRTLEERRALRAATLSNLMLEAAPVVDQFFADLNAQGKYPTYEERRAMANYVENHNLFPHQRKSWEKALANVTPKYLSDDERAIRDMDHDDNVTAADLKKALGTASPRVGDAVQNR